LKAEWLKSAGGAGVLIALLILIGVNLAVRYTDVYLAALQFTHENGAIESTVGSATTLFVLPVFVTYGGRDSDYYKRAWIVMLVSGSRRSGLVYLHVDQQPDQWVVSAATVCRPFNCDPIDVTGVATHTAVPR
jgi:hypothetical protein